MGRALSCFLISFCLRNPRGRLGWAVRQSSIGDWQLLERGGGRGSGDAAPKRGDDTLVRAWSWRPHRKRVQGDQSLVTPNVSVYTHACMYVSVRLVSKQLDETGPVVKLAGPQGPSLPWVGARGAGVSWP